MHLYANMFSVYFDCICPFNICISLICTHFAVLPQSTRLNWPPEFSKRTVEHIYIFYLYMQCIHFINLVHSVVLLFFAYRFFFSLSLILIWSICLVVCFVEKTHIWLISNMLFVLSVFVCLFFSLSLVGFIPSEIVWLPYRMQRRWRIIFIQTKQPI